jgi:hypothetical protein
LEYIDSYGLTNDEAEFKNFVEHFIEQNYFGVVVIERGVKTLNAFT